MLQMADQGILSEVHNCNAIASTWLLHPVLQCILLVVTGNYCKDWSPWGAALDGVTRSSEGLEL